MNRRNQKGFTLIELLLVVIIIGILAAIVVPKLAGKSKEAQIAASQADLKTIGNALDRYELDNGEYPSSEQGLLSLIELPNPEPKKWKGPYIKAKNIPRDPWGNEYVYAFPGSTSETDYDLRSSGPDGIEMNEDDIDMYGQVEGDEQADE